MSAGGTGFKPVGGAGFHPASATAVDIFVPLDWDKAITVKQRHLPHWRQEGATYFVTFRLGDSLPAHILAQWHEELEVWLRLHPEPWKGKTIAEYQARFVDGREEWFDRGFGECLLAQSQLRKVVVDSLLHFHGELYLLDSYVVMPNHVHVLVKPLPGVALSDMVGGWKRHSAREIHKILGRSGALWMEESHDRIVRDAVELGKYRDYILKNPQKAGLPMGQYSVELRNVMKTESDGSVAQGASGGGEGTGCNPVQPTGSKPVLQFPLCEIRDHDDWKKLPGEMVYPGKYVQIEECAYLTPARPETPVHWTVAHRKSAIAVAPITDDGKFILIHQERLPVQRTLWEFPAGQLDDGETHEAILDTVHRELDEEAGCVVAPEGTLTPLGWFFGSQGFTNEHVYLFAAHPVRIVRTPQPVGGEHIGEVRLVTGAELRQMVASHVIQDALTLALFARMAAHGMV